jgi:hypothetical protein
MPVDMEGPGFLTARGDDAPSHEDLESGLINRLAHEEARGVDYAILNGAMADETPVAL